MLRLPFLLVTLAFLAACSGGGHGPSALPTTVPLAPGGRAAFQITIPKQPVSASAKRPALISPNTATIVLSVTSVNGVTPNPAPQPLKVSITDPTYCTSTATAITCSINYTVPIATSIIVEIVTLDANGKQLGIGFLGPVDTTQPTQPPVKVALGGYPASAQFTATAVTAVNTGSSTPVNLTAVLKVYDGEGNLLISPDTYGGSVAIAVNNDTTHAIGLTTTQLTAPDTTAGASNTIPLTYTSSNVLAPNVELTATFNGTTLATLPIAALTVFPSSLPNLTVGGSAQTVTISEPFNTQKYTIGGAINAAAVACSPGTCAPSIAGGSVTLNVTPTGAGAQTITVTDAYGTSVQVPVTVTGTSGGGGLVAPAYNVYEYANPSAFGSYGPTSHGNYGIVTGPDGMSLWFVDQYHQALGEVYNPAYCNGTATVCSLSEGYLAYGTSPPNSTAIAVGSDGALYVNDTGNIDIPSFGSLLQERCSGSGTLTCSGTQTSPAPSATIAPNDVKTAPDGNVYLTAGYSSAGPPAVASQILYEPIPGCCSSTAFRSISVAPAPSIPNIMTVDRSGQKMFFTDTGNGTIGHFSLNCSSSCSAAESNFAGMTAPLEGIVEASDGYLYVAEPNAHRIDRISASVALSCASNCAMQSISLPSGSNAAPENLAIGADGNVWFTDASPGAGYIGFISLYQCANAACKAVEYPVPSAGSAPWGITAGPDGNIWFTESVPTGATLTGHIGEVQIQPWVAPPLLP